MAEKDAWPGMCLCREAQECARTALGQGWPYIVKARDGRERCLQGMAFDNMLLHCLPAAIRGLVCR